MCLYCWCNGEGKLEMVYKNRNTEGILKGIVSFKIIFFIISYVTAVYHFLLIS